MSEGTGTPREEEHAIDLRRVIPAPPDRVFQAWLQPEAVRRWMCPDPSVRITRLEWTPAVGDPYRIGMDVGGDIVWFEGEFLTVDPPNRMAFTWISSRTDEQETVVTISLRPVAGGTELRLRHEALPDPAAALDHERGWDQILRRLEDHVA